MKKYISLVLLVLSMLSVNSLFAAEPKERFSELEIENLIHGIKADNEGLMRSSVYFAGKYKIAESAPALVEVLKSESDPSNIILIALAIYEIGDDEAMMELINVANNSLNSNVKHMLTALTIQYLSNSGMLYVLR